MQEIMEETNVEEKVMHIAIIRGQVIAGTVTVTVMEATGVAEAAGMGVTEEVVAMTEEVEEEGAVMEVAVAGVVMEVVAAVDVIKARSPLQSPLYPSTMSWVYSKYKHALLTFH